MIYSSFQLINTLAATLVNKIQIRQAVEQIFKVKVLSVNTINVKGKPKRMGAFMGKTRSWKKAIVALPEGQRIEFFEGASV